jgi:hypothetical protein
VNRKLLVVVVVAAIVALIAGVQLGRHLLSPSTKASAQKVSVVRFKDEISQISISYPSDWTRLPLPSNDAEVSLLADHGPGASLLIRVSQVGLAPVRYKTLSIVRKFTDGLVGADPRTHLLVAPNKVSLGGLPGWRYRYTYGTGSSAGAHDHYFLFKDGLVIQLVFQAQPANDLPGLEPLFQSIAGTFRGRDK